MMQCNGDDDPISGISFIPPIKKSMVCVSDCFLPQDLEGEKNQGRGAKFHLTVPGAFVSPAQGLMRGHGTFLDNSGERILSSLSGAILQTNKLLRVRPVKSRYQGEVGDVVIGRVIEVQQKRWRVDIGARTHAVLLLASVNLPGGELRRKSIEDELQMREYLREGDLVSAEVQQCYFDGSLSLHTRSLRYGKLGQGQLVRVPSHLIRKRKTHIHNLPFGVSVILGRNGFVWISPLINTEEGQTGGWINNFDLVATEIREAIARYANCIHLLERNSIPLTDTTIIVAYKASLNFPTRMLMYPDIADDVAQDVIAQCTAANSDSLNLGIQGVSIAAENDHSLEDN